jgi:hypothetical protein
MVLLERHPSIFESLILHYASEVGTANFFLSPLDATLREKG